MRRTISITLVLAFLPALAAPARAAWSCPDGTPCVPDRQQGFVCAEKKCAAQASSCCVAKTTRCKHGAGPVVAPDRPGGPVLQAPDHCRYHVSAKPRVPAVAETVKPLSFGVDVVLPAPTFRLSLAPVPPVWRSELTLGCRPPPLVFSGPSRAPPQA